jgi:hypothetical protein
MRTNIVKRAGRKILHRVGFSKKRSPKRFFFNADLNVILEGKGPRIVFVHVGKCAGESILKTLGAILPLEIPIFEMHCYDANHRIRDVAASENEDVIFLIAKREPVARFVSAFNWDKYNLYLSGKLKGKPAEIWYDTMPTINDLAAGLRCEDPDLRLMAERFSQFAHMHMGQSWYTPDEVLDMLPRERTFVTDIASLKADLGRLFHCLDIKISPSEWEVPRTKDDYGRKFSNPASLFPRDLSDADRNVIRARISKDIECYERLDRDFAGVLR